jgi:hypothetical protein
MFGGVKCKRGGVDVSGPMRLPINVHAREKLHHVSARPTSP